MSSDSPREVREVDTDLVPEEGPRDVEPMPGGRRVRLVGLLLLIAATAAAVWYGGTLVRREVVNRGESTAPEAETVADAEGPNSDEPSVAGDGPAGGRPQREQEQAEEAFGVAAHEAPTEAAPPAVVPTPSPVTGPGADSEKAGDGPEPAATGSGGSRSPEEEKPTPPRPDRLEVLRQGLEFAQQSYEHEVAELAAPILAAHAGEEWESVRRFLTLAESEAAPLEERIKAYRNAAAALEALVPLIRLRGVQQAAADRSVLLEELLTLRREFPESPAIADALDDSRRWSADVWLALAAAEIKAAAPDDPGYAEIRLVMARLYDALGRSDAAREALRAGWKAVERMTDPERAVASAIDLIAYESSKRPAPEQRFLEVAELTGQISGPERRAEALADLAGLAAVQGGDALFDTLLNQSLEAAQESRFLQDYPAVVTCRALSRTAPPAQILELCREVPKYNGHIGVDPFPANAMCYGYAAIAAARQGDQRAHREALLRAHAQLACYDSFIRPAAFRVLGRAELKNGRGRQAMNSARNLADPRLRASILFPLLVQSAEAVEASVAQPLLEETPDARHAVAATAAHVRRQVRAGGDLGQVLNWIGDRPIASLRAAGYAGIAQAARLGPAQAVEEEPGPEQAPLEPDPENVRSLLQAAEQAARSVEDPVGRGYAWLAIAGGWNSLGDAENRRRAEDEIYAATDLVWRWYDDRQFRGHRRLRGSLYYRGDSHVTLDLPPRWKRELTAGMTPVGELLVALAEQRVAQGRSEAAVEACLDAAHAMQACYGNSSRMWLLLRMQAVLTRVADQTEIPAGVLDWPYHSPPANAYKQRYGLYPRCVMAAAAGDLAALRQTLERLEAVKSSQVSSSHVARAHAEVCVLLARTGDVDGYRDARRRTMSLIDHESASRDITLVLAEADAWAGEFGLAANNLETRSLGWYGPDDRPRAVLAGRLARAGELEQALEHLAGVSHDEPRWRVTAVRSVAASRSRAESAAAALAWVEALESPLDRAAALCGLAAAEP